MNQLRYDFNDVVKLIAGSVVTIIFLSLIGLVACKLGSELGGPMMNACQAINLMVSMPSGTIFVLFLILAGIIIKSAGGREGTRARA